MNQSNSLIPASKTTPCPHCGKPDWCYFLGDEISVCKRNQEPAPGWEDIGKFDKEGAPMYVRQREKPSYSGEKKTTYYPYTLRDGSNNLRVRRIDSANKEKDIKPQHLDAETGEWKTSFGPYNRPDIRIYRYEETREAIEKGLPIIICEGEGKVDALREKGLAACCNIGGSKKWRKTDTMDLAGAKEIYIAPDCDKPGIEHAKLLLKEFPQAKFLLPFKDSPRWENIPEKHGVDIKNYLDDYPSLTGDEIITQLSVEASDVPFLDRLEFPKFSNEQPKKERSYEDSEPTEVVKIYTQKALDELFSGHWIAIAGELYQWNGTHYELQGEPETRNRIAKWLNEYAERTPQGLKYVRASKRAVSEILGWAVDNFSISPDRVNPPGLNFRNGVLEIYWEGKRAVWELLPHDPARHYIYCSDIEYNPRADKADCEKLLSCLPAPQRKIFLQTIAASLDIPTIRKFRGRMVRMLIAYGSGSNGKDTLRAVVQAIFGHGLTTASLSDFQAYDQGRKFPLAKLDGSRINWPSENSQFAVIDNIQSIKLFATGDPLSIERKNKDEYCYIPHAIGIFNCNNLPIIKAVDEAILSRWAFLKFPYTFKSGANPARGEIEADPRFKYDPDFLKSKVAPALLNEILQALENLAEEGIDYEPCAETLEEAREESSHLRQFAKSVGLVESPGQRVYVSDLWKKLNVWYLETGTAVKEEGRDKITWNSFPNNYDKPITGLNQVAARFQEIFACSRGTETLDRSRLNQVFLSGIGFSGEADVKADVRQMLRQMLRQFSLIYKECEAVKAVLPELIQFLLQLPGEEKAEICKALCQCKSESLQLPSEEKAETQPTPQPTDEQEITRMIEELREALPYLIPIGDYSILEKIMDVPQKFKKAVWAGLTKEERQAILDFKKASKPQPELPPSPPDPPPANRVGDAIRHRKDLNKGTITHIYADGNRAMVDFEIEEGKVAKVCKIKSLDLIFRQTKFEKPQKNDTRTYKPGLIHELEMWMPGQTILSQKGNVIGKIIKGCSGGVVIANCTGKQEKLLFKDADLMDYQRAWVLGEGWEYGFEIVGIQGVKNTYTASLREMGQWYCDINRGDKTLVTSFIGKTPQIYAYNSAKDWMKECIEIFLKNEEKQ